MPTTCQNKTGSGTHQAYSPTNCAHSCRIDGYSNDPEKRTQHNTTKHTNSYKFLIGPFQLQVTFPLFSINQVERNSNLPHKPDKNKSNTSAEDRIFLNTIHRGKKY